MSQLNTIRKLLTAVLIVLLATSSGCDVAVIEGSEVEFFIAKDWKIIEYYRDNELMTDKILASEDKGELGNFVLQLNEDFTFNRTNFKQETDSGTWSLASGLTQLVLISDDPEKSANWLILDLEVRRLELKLIPGAVSGRVDDLDGIHNGNARLILEPVRGQ